jgi:KaiC/GvpD/RAD55 family RecA-like ATPase
LLVNIEEEFFTEEAEIFADGVIHFQRLQSLKRGEVNYLVEIIKMRLSNHSKEIREYKITSEGIKIFSKYGVI